MFDFWGKILEDLIVENLLSGELNYTVLKVKISTVPIKFHRER